MTTDPSVVRSLAISTEDLVAAIEANRRDDRQTVLRATPPYSGRMRARLHVVQPEADEADETLHVPPEALLSADAPPYPDPDETADELRADDAETYSVDRHREYHEQRVDDWRASLSDAVVDSIELPAVGHEVSIALLGE
jgi:hypothetical protein